MVCNKVKELTRTFQDHAVGPCGSSMVLRYDGCNVMQQLFAHLFGTIFSTFQSQNRPIQVLHKNAIVVVDAIAAVTTLAAAASALL